MTAGTEGKKEHIVSVIQTPFGKKCLLKTSLGGNQTSLKVTGKEDSPRKGKRLKGRVSDNLQMRVVILINNTNRGIGLSTKKKGHTESIKGKGGVRLCVARSECMGKKKSWSKGVHTGGVDAIPMQGRVKKNFHYRGRADGI